MDNFYSPLSHNEYIDKMFNFRSISNNDHPDFENMVDYLNEKTLFVFEYSTDIDEYEDECPLEIQNQLRSLFAKHITNDVEDLYEKKRLIPMVSYNLFTYKVNDYQFTLKSDPDNIYIVHTNFLIENMGRDKWYRCLDEKDISVQFYKIPTNPCTSPDVWIDDCHIIKYPRNRESALKRFIMRLRRFGYPPDRNDFEPYKLETNLTKCELMESYGIDDNDPVGEMDDDDSDDIIYRRTLQFPNFPDNATKLDPLLLSYQNYNNNKEIIGRIDKILAKLEPAQRIQAILCFRISNQVIGK